jgi:hypothetical protein
MKQLKVHYKAARSYIHSPDLEYELKFNQVLQALDSAVAQERVVLFLDELTFYNQPSTANAYEKAGNEQPKAQRALGAEKSGRILGALNAITGQVCFAQKSKITTSQLIAFLKQIVQTYPNKQIDIVMDNWPVHYHPDVLAALEPQTYQHQFNTPPSWKNIKPKTKYLNLNLPIQFIPLPTYASWLNPIEKLWKWLKKDLIHNHIYANDWTTFKELINTFLTQFDKANPQLLQFVGLKNHNTIYGKCLLI